MSDSLQTVIDNSHGVIEKGTSIITYSASGATVIGGIALNEWMAIGGFAIAALSLAFNIWFKMKYKRPKPEEGNQQC